ncbi:hypothetical protein CW304_01430 [Bacillus sp. UFRGS-B20]|nr:hypothetical protein CW304_01430 [Bacillus sp. UFRGS-B20]
MLKKKSVTIYQNNSWGASDIVKPSTDAIQASKLRLLYCCLLDNNWNNADQNSYVPLPRTILQHSLCRFHYQQGSFIFSFSNYALETPVDVQHQEQIYLRHFQITPTGIQGEDVELPLATPHASGVAALISICIPFFYVPYRKLKTK